MLSRMGLFLEYKVDMKSSDLSLSRENHFRWFSLSSEQSVLYYFNETFPLHISVGYSPAMLCYVAIDLAASL